MRIVKCFVARDKICSTFEKAVFFLTLDLGRARTCRCTFRNAPQGLYNQGICPDRVTAVNTNNDIGICQRDAKNNAPSQCRQYYGHCGWLQ